MTERDDDGLCPHCGAPLYPSERIASFAKNIRTQESAQ